MSRKRHEGGGDVSPSPFSINSDLLKPIICKDEPEKLGFFPKFWHWIRDGKNNSLPPRE